jgi:pimeloyl-ACP methyl ester carboxylesterase
MRQRLDDAQRARLGSEGQLTFPSVYEPEPLVVTRGLIEEGRNHLLLEAPIPFAGPVRLIHGIEDPDVPWLVSVSIADRLTSPDVEIILVKGAGHRLSEPADLARLCAIVSEMSDKIG